VRGGHPGDDDGPAREHSWRLPPSAERVPGPHESSVAEAVRNPTATLPAPITPTMARASRSGRPTGLCYSRGTRARTLPRGSFPANGRRPRFGRLLRLLPEQSQIELRKRLARHWSTRECGRNRPMPPADCDHRARDHSHTIVLAAEQEFVQAGRIAGHVQALLAHVADPRPAPDPRPGTAPRRSQCCRSL
jgi:hypothetical protein